MKDSEIEDEFQEIRSHLQKLSEQFDQLSTDTIDKVSIQNRVLKDCLAEQPELHINWEAQYTSFYNLERRSRMIVDVVYAKAYNKELSNSYKSLTATEAKNLALSNADYIRTKRLHNDCLAAKDDCEVILNTVRSRQFTLKDITNAVVAGVESHII